MEKDSLANKTIKGIGWNSIDRIACYGISFIVGIILARLLSPDEYGLIGLIGVFIAIFNIILDSGLSTAIIRKESVTDCDYCTVFYANLFLSIILTGLLYASSTTIGLFFERPDLSEYIQVMSFILIINALSLTQQARLTKQVDFKTQTVISVAAHSISGIIGIILAYEGYGVWALVMQQLSSRGISTILLWIFNRWIPKLMFSWLSFRELFGFSWKLLLAQIISTIWNQTYQAVIGKVYAPSVLGQYTRANQYSSLCSSSIGDVVLKVSLPVMSSIQNDDDRLLHAYRIIIKTTMFVTFILMFCMAASAKSLIFVLIGSKWMPCVPMMQILCFSLVLYPLHLININMLTVQGRSDIQLVLQVIKCIIAIGPILLGIFVGIYWMLFGSVLTSWLSLILNSYYSGRKFSYTWWMQLKDIMPSIGIAVMIALPIFLLSLIDVSCYLLLFIQLGLGLVWTIIVCEYFNTEEYTIIRNIILERISKRINCEKNC